MGDVLIIEFRAGTYYSEYALLRMRGWTPEMLGKARRDEGLRSTQVGRERLYKGEWLQEWLDGRATS